MQRRRSFGVENLNNRRYGSQRRWMVFHKVLLYVRNILLQTWMLALYFVLDDTEVTQELDLRRKEMAMSLSLFCF